MVFPWHGWPLDRVLILFLGLLYLMLFVQVTLYHYRQNFRHWAMWIPVIVTPLDGILLIWLAFFNADWLRTTLVLLLAASLLAGMFGSYLHWRGIGERVGGYTMRNFLVGPPALLPAMITGSSLLGLIALYWR
jgi:ABC-type sulfate transport system permease component